MPAKNCSVCGKRKQASLENFHEDPKGLYGVRADCKVCRATRDAKRRAPKSAASIKFAEYIPETDQEQDDEQDEGSDEAITADEAFRILGKSPEVPKAKQVVLKKGTPYSLVILNDVHIPDHDLPAWKAVVSYLKANPPDELVLNGDFMELESCSQHGGNIDVISLTSDFEKGRAALTELRNAVPNSKITYMQGNHETRLERFIASRAPSLSGSLTVQAGLHLDDFKIEWVPELQQPIRRGNLDIIHGHQMTSLPRYLASRLVDLYGESGRVIVMGHSHRAQSYSHAGVNGNKWGYSFGCLRTLDPKWLHGAKSGWSHQIAQAYVDESGAVNVYPITITKGSFVWAGKKYS